MPWPDAMDCRRGSCLAGDVNCETLRPDLLRQTNCGSCRRLWTLKIGSAVARRKALRGKAEGSAGTIEVEIAGVTVRVGRGADVKTLMAVLRALKAGA